MRNLDDHESSRPGPRPDAAVNPERAGAGPEWTRHVAWADREAAVGRVPEPDAWVLDDVESWDLEPWDPEPVDWEPDGPSAGDLGRPLFAQDGVADVMAPSPFLAALTEQAVADVAGLSDSELVGVLRASRRQVAREQYKQALATAEFGRRRHAAFTGALARGVPAGCAAGGFPGEELAIELVVTRGEAGHLIDNAIDLTARLPRTLAGMAEGLIDAGRAGWIAYYTRSLDPADAARADDFLAGEAPDLRAEQLARKAAAQEMKLNPDGVKARRERARRDGQRVEAGREASGNASLAGRELDTADVLASKAYLDAVAARLRESGIPGSLDWLRALAMTDLTQGRDPLDRVAPGPVPAPRPGHDEPTSQNENPGPAGTTGPAGNAGAAEYTGPAESTGQAGDGDTPAGRPARPAPVPALVNLIIPAGTLLGFSAAPAQAGAWGLLDAAEARAVAGAAAAHPRTRWCVTLTGPDGTALAHGCARGPRPRLLTGLAPQPPPAPPLPASLPAPSAQLAGLLRRLGITFTPIAKCHCDPTAAEDRYTPSRKLAHLVRARTATCDAPGCDNPAAGADLDHTVPWPDGPTDQTNLAPACQL